MFLTWKRLTALSYTFYIQTNTSHLRDTTEAVSASHGVHVTSSLLGTSMVSTNTLIHRHNRKSHTNCSIRRTTTYLRLKGMLDSD